MNKNFRAGIVSVTFRQYDFIDIIKYIKLTDMSCIEWGSDIHLPYGEQKKAAAVAQEMAKNNLAAASYGSYYRLGQPCEPGLVSMIIETAKKISAPMIRVWGGTTGSGSLDSQGRKKIIDDALIIAESAKKENIKISLEYHADTITDTAESALDFIKEVRQSGGENVYLYWQQNQYKTFGENKAELELICPYISNIHVFAWEKNERLPLIEHRGRWESYINILKDAGENHDFLLEFVKGDTVGQMVEDAKVLIDLHEKN